MDISSGLIAPLLGKSKPCLHLNIWNEMQNSTWKYKANIDLSLRRNNSNVQAG